MRVKLSKKVIFRSVLNYQLFHNTVLFFFKHQTSLNILIIQVLTNLFVHGRTKYEGCLYSGCVNKCLKNDKLTSEGFKENF